MVSIGISRALACSLGSPRHRSLRMKQPLAVHHTLRHLFQVVKVHEVFSLQHFILHGPTITVDLHLVKVGKSRLTYQGIINLIDARRRHAHLGPSALGQYRVVCIPVFGQYFLAGLGHFLHGRSLLGLHFKHKAHQFPVFAITHHQWHERHFKVSALPFHHYIGINMRPFVQGFCRDFLITLHIISTHIHKFGICDGGRIY